MRERDRKLREKARELTLALTEILRLAGLGSMINQPVEMKQIRGRPQLTLLEGGKSGEKGSKDEKS